MRANAEDFVRIMQAEAGFTRSDAQGEVTRCCETLRLSAEEARRLAGRVVPIEGAPGQARRLAFTLTVPLGVVLAVTPFNSPLNTVTHKIAPAFAAGNAVVLKPSSSTPMTAIRLAELLLEAGMPEGFLSVLLGGAAVVSRAVADERVRFVAFTGSTEVGQALQSSAGLRRTQMELGSIAFTIVADDADLDLALPRIDPACADLVRPLRCPPSHRESQARRYPRGFGGGNRPFGLTRGPRRTNPDGANSLQCNKKARQTARFGKGETSAAA